MNLGQIVQLNNPNEFWVIMELYKKTCKGIVKTKFFKKLQSENKVPEFRPYTKNRMSYAKVVKPSSLEKDMFSIYEKMNKMNFVEWAPDK